MLCCAGLTCAVLCRADGGVSRNSCVLLLTCAVLCRADGGVSRNSCVLQLIATLTGQSVTRAACTEQSALGAALMAGIGAGIIFAFS